MRNREKKEKTTKILDGLAKKRGGGGKGEEVGDVPKTKDNLNNRYKEKEKVLY